MELLENSLCLAEPQLPLNSSFLTVYSIKYTQEQEKAVNHQWNGRRL